MKKIFGLFTASLILCTTFSGCSSVNKRISTDGSTSMEKLVGVLGETFENNTDITVTYNPTGSGSGIKAVASGSCDIGLTSRQLKDEEKSLGLTETVIANDGIAVIVNPDNPVSDLDSETIAGIYTGEISNWNEIGGNDSEIVLIGREAGSGTRNGFEDAVNIAGKCSYRQELTSSGDIITTVSRNPSAIGYVSVASVKDNVKTLSVNGIYPTESAIKDGNYIIQRPFILVTKSDKELSENVNDFLDYVISESAEEIISLAGVVAAN